MPYKWRIKEILHHDAKKDNLQRDPDKDESKNFIQLELPQKTEKRE